MCGVSCRQNKSIRKVKENSNFRQNRFPIGIFGFRGDCLPTQRCAPNTHYTFLIKLAPQCFESSATKSVISIFRNRFSWKISVCACIKGRWISSFFSLVDFKIKTENSKCTLSNLLSNMVLIDWFSVFPIRNDSMRILFFFLQKNNFLIIQLLISWGWLERNYLMKSTESIQCSLNFAMLRILCHRSMSGAFSCDWVKVEKVIVIWHDVPMLSPVRGELCFLVERKTNFDKHEEQRQPPPKYKQVTNR